MKFYFDENFSPRIARGLNVLEKDKNIEVVNIIDEFGRGAADEEWIPVVGDEEKFVITQDYNLHRIRQQRELYIQYKLGIFIFRPPAKRGFLYWDWVEFIIKKGEQVKQKAIHSSKPFGFMISSRTSKAVDLNEV